MWSRVLIAGLLLTLPGCTLFSYDLTVPTGAPAPSAVRTGRDCGMAVLGLGFGELSVGDAMKQGGITNPSKVTLSQNTVLIFAENCLIVEGSGEASNTSTTTAPRPESDPDSGYGYRQRK